MIVLFLFCCSAPVPDAVIAQEPEGDVVVGEEVSLDCSASIPQPNSLSFSITILWTDSEGSVINSTNERVGLTPAVESTPNEFVSTLAITSVSADLDSAYTCIAETSVEDAEFVTSEPAMETLSLVIVGKDNDH